MLLTMCDVWRGECYVEEGEALAVRIRMKTVVEVGFRALTSETDSLVLCAALRRHILMC